ncbi:hypothetical protein QYM36_019892 [Artemia franciscana]|uniref:RanBD1 domain-containing protein n=1 Tax=Artemia franciscana TaxID=6661 RepID=A0AA88H0M2_ARTSF|nr:hypothetical protein QYM36_019892 [Artemia franciscana]
MELEGTQILTEVKCDATDLCKEFVDTAGARNAIEQNAIKQEGTQILTEVKGNATDLCKESVDTAGARNAVEHNINTLDLQTALPNKQYSENVDKQQNEVSHSAAKDGENTEVTSVFGTNHTSISESGTAKHGTSTPVNLTIRPITKTTSAPELDKGTKPISSAIGANSAGSFQVRTTATSTTAHTKPRRSLIQPKFTIGSSPLLSLLLKAQNYSQLLSTLSEILAEEKKKEETAKPPLLEEEETVLFSNHGVLYRFDANIKEWKEKGRGDFKVLRHKKTGKVRFLMRRAQVLKICCNHLIAPELELMPMNYSVKAFVWYAHDYSEGEIKEEKLALRFKLPDTAKQFKQVVDKVKEELAKPSGETEKPESVEKD